MNYINSHNKFDKNCVLYFREKELVTEDTPIIVINSYVFRD